MLNPELYNIYDKKVVDAFKGLAETAEREGCKMILCGTTETYGVKAPDMVISDKECPNVDILTVVDIFKVYAPKATPAERDLFGDISYVAYHKGYEEMKGESTLLWVR